MAQESEKHKAVEPDPEHYTVQLDDAIAVKGEAVFDEPVAELKRMIHTSDGEVAYIHGKVLNGGVLIGHIQRP